MKSVKSSFLKPRITLVGLFLIVMSGMAMGSDRSVSVIPAPLYIETGVSGYRLKNVEGISSPDHEGIQNNVAWIAGLIERKTGVSFNLEPGRDSKSNIRVELIDRQELTAKFLNAGTSAPWLLNEAYTLNADPRGITIRAAHPAGLFYGMSTFWQLATSGTGEIPELEILDAPQFEWRGLMLDSARHMQSVEFIKTYIDWMALHKLNVFHWHFTDDQAWRLEIKAYPKLAETGGFRVPAGAAPTADIDPETGKPRLYGGFYTQDQVREIVTHAAGRNVTVVPEIDVPGHATAAIAAYPELGVSGHGITRVPANWGIYNNVFNLEESTFKFLETVLDEVVQLFPGRFIHLGGDEVQIEQWEGSERIQQRMKELGIEDLQSLQNYYVERLQSYLDKYDRRVIGWDEILESELPAHAAVMSWRGVEGAVNAAAKGHQAVLSPAPTLYLDHIQTSSADAPPGRGGVITTRDIYAFDPLPESLGDNREFVLGLQGNVWTEHIRTEDRVSYMTWPRATAIAELGWSNAAKRDWQDFEHRLATHKPRLASLGVTLGRQTVNPPPVNPMRREDRELELCSNGIVLALEDDAPIMGERESYLFDIMNPCWIWRDAKLVDVDSVSARVGQLPFNFEIGKDIENVVVEAPKSVHGELNIRLGDCDGPLLATSPLAPAIENQAATELPKAALLIEDLPDRGDLCFSFTRHGIDPMWAIDWIQLNGVGK